MRPFHFHLSTLQFVVRLVCAATLLGGCNESGLSAALTADPKADALGAQQLEVTPNSTVTIDNDFAAAEVQVVAYPTEEVALDYIFTGWGDTDNQALAEASVLVTMTRDLPSNGATIWARPNNMTSHVPNPQDNMLLHVRVPQDCHVVVESKGGNVTVLGAVQSVSAHTGNGDIVARGIAGPLKLVTDHGAITADDRTGGPVHLDLDAANGDITIFALAAVATVHATNGSIRFTGTFYQLPHGPVVSPAGEFKASGSGNILIAVPDNLPYRFQATGGTRILADFAVATEPCGLLDPPTREYHLQMQLASSSVGRVEASGTTTSTGYLTGTMENGIFLFRTNRDPIAIFDPPKHLPRTPGVLDVGMIGYCGRDNDANVKDVNTFFTAQAESGDIWIHQIATQK